MRKKLKDVLKDISYYEKFFQIYFETYAPADYISGIFPNLSTYAQGLQEFLYENIGPNLTATGYMEHSNDKYISKFFDELTKDWNEDSLPSEWDYFEQRIMYRIAPQITNRYFLNWVYLYKAYLKESYNPLENYSMTETRTPNITKSHIASISGSGSMSTDTDITQTGSNDSETGLFAFNSSSGDTAIPTNAGNTSSSIRTQGTGTNNKTTSSDTKSETIYDTETGTDSLTRSGNIGVTTSQQMLNSELELRKFDLLERIFSDLDKILCLKIY